MYFDACKSLEELKRAYKKLALENHPDMGGNVDVMKAINCEYDRAFERLKHRQNAAAAEPDSTVKATSETPEEFKRVIEMLLKIEGIEIELCGSWLWISGNTYEAKDEIKAAGCRWSKSKHKWYWHPSEDKPKRYHRAASMGWIRGKYGSQQIAGTRNERQVLTA